MVYLVLRLPLAPQHFLSSLFAIIHCGHKGLFLSCSSEHFVMPFVNIWYKIQTSHTKSIYMAIFLFLFMLFWLRYSVCSFPVHSSILLLPLDYDVSISSFFCLRNAIELHLLLQYSANAFSRSKIVRLVARICYGGKFIQLVAAKDCNQSQQKLFRCDKQIQDFPSWRSGHCCN